jgi:hypothetical protein
VIDMELRFLRLPDCAVDSHEVQALTSLPQNDGRRALLNVCSEPAVLKCRFGSKGNVTVGNRHVSFTPMSGH